MSGLAAMETLPVVVPVVAAGLAFCAYIGRFNGNVRVVDPGRAFRSAVLSPRQLRRVIRKHGIRTVLSLRGGNPERPWYRRQLEVCAAECVAVDAITLSAQRLPSPKKLRRVIRLLDAATYPLLFHCQAGADRSGLVAALYQILYLGWPIERAAADSLTWRYGHFRFDAPAMDLFFDLLKEQAPADVRNWLFREYPAVYARHGDRPIGGPLTRRKE